MATALRKTTPAATSKAKDATALLRADHKHERTAELMGEGGL